MPRICALVVAATLTLSAWAAAANELRLEIFVSEPEEINVTSPLIMGPTEMMVVSAQGTKSAAARLADLIESKGLDLRYIFLTHPHLDHSQGAGILLERFPEAQFVTTPEIARLQHHRIPLDDAVAQARYGDNAAVPSVPVGVFEEETLLIDGQPIEIWKDIVGDVGVAEPDEPHIALHIAALNALMPSDAVYFDAHVFLGGTTEESRALWIAQLDAWLERGFDIVVPGHMPKGAPLTAEGALVHTRDYIIAYDRAMAESETSDEVIEKMLTLYPDLAHQSALYLGTWINFKEMRKISFNPAAQAFPEGASEAEIQAIDAERYEDFKRAYNPQD